MVLKDLVGGNGVINLYADVVLLNYHNDSIKYFEGIAKDVPEEYHDYIVEDILPMVKVKNVHAANNNNYCKYDGYFSILIWDGE